MTRPRIVLIAGDGIGREVIPAARQVLTALLRGRVDFVEAEAGWEVFERTGEALPRATVEKLQESDGALFGAVSSPSGPVPGYRSPIVALRRELDLFANLRPAKSRDGTFDLLIVRENTEGLYIGEERWESRGGGSEDCAVALRRISRRASGRIGRVALEMARKRRRVGRVSRLTIVHKANVLPLTDGLFRDAVLAEAEDFPEVEVEEMLADAMLYRMIREPQRFHVVVAPNLFGDLLSDAAVALVGGLGLLPSANQGADFCLAEPVHGSAPDIAGQGIANPLATFRSAALLLRHLGRGEEAGRLEGAVERVLEQGPWTPDLGGDARTEYVTREVIEALAAP